MAHPLSMSALIRRAREFVRLRPCLDPLWVSSRHSPNSTSCPLFYREQTFISLLGMTASGQNLTLLGEDARPDPGLWGAYVLKYQVIL